MNTTIEKAFTVDHPIDVVWEAITTPEKIVECVPGAQLTEHVDADNFKGTVELKFGPVKAAYEGLITFKERNQADKKMVMKGSGSDVKGKGGADMLLTGILKPSSDPAHTDMVVTMEVSVTGMLAQFGSRLVNDATNHVFDQFVKNFKDQLAGREINNTLSAGSMVGSMIKGLFS
jgi:uncharacterized protein